MATTRYSVTCLSPVHIGTGTQLGKFDGVYSNGRWYVIDLDKIFAQGVGGDELAQAMSSDTFSWAEWLQGRRIPVGEVALYSLPCPQDPREVYIREGMKDVYLQPYIPGSTLKGAIRTAVLWHLLQHNRQARRFVRHYLLLATFAKDIRDRLREIARGNRDAEQDPNNHRRAIEHALEIENAEELESCLQVLYEAIGKDLRQARQGNRRERLGMRELERLKQRQREADPVGTAISARRRPVVPAHPTLDALADELSRVRRQGYAYDLEEVSIGLCCVAAPIRDYEGQVVAAVSFSTPTHRFQMHKMQYTRAIVEGAQRISERLGYFEKEPVCKPTRSRSPSSVPAILEPT